MATPYVIAILSDEEEEDDLQVLEFHKETQNLIQQVPPKTVKKLSEAECPVCFDFITNATTTPCGHIYCLECLQRSVSASSARGQTRGRKGVGLCPMCRKTVSFKDTIVLRLKTGKVVAPPSDEKPDADAETRASDEEISSEALDKDLADLF